MTGMVAGQIPIAATATSVTSSVATLAASFMPAHTGDVTSPAGSTVNTLATVNGNVGTFQGLTVNAKGLVTAAANQSYVTGGPYLPTAGGSLSGGLTVTGDVTASNNLHAGGGLYLGNPYILFNGNTVTTAGPYIQFDNTNFAARLGAGNGVFTLQNSGGTSIFSMNDTGDLGILGSLQSVWSIPRTNNSGYCGSPTQAWTQANAYNFNTVSDARLKSDIADLPDCLDVVRSIAPKQFKFNPPDRPDPAFEHIHNRTHWGFVADEIAIAGFEGSRSTLRAG